MNFLTPPHLIYILGAYGVSLLSLCLFLGMVCFQWKRSIRQLENAIRET